MTFAPIKYVVPGIIVEGLTLLAGKPKLGKSWLLLHAAVAARGGFTLGELQSSRATFSIRPRRQSAALAEPHDEATRVFAGLADAARLSMRDAATRERRPRRDQGLDQIQDCAPADHHRHARDGEGTKNARSNNYDADYAAALELRTLASEAGIAIVLVHHLRKADADDAYDTVSGTLGLTGAPDTILVLKRDTSGTIVLYGRGRDLTEIEMAMSFDKDSCLWRITGDADEVAVRVSATPSSLPSTRRAASRLARTTSPPRPACAPGTSVSCSASWSRRAQSTGSATANIDGAARRKSRPRCERVSLPLTLLTLPLTLR